eukprot:GHVU01208026.1.p1 GENE.GHVU01208026.1~~GHVU01208026.1.p1  ORF type:complete len:287 (+),score=102.09 GHVU01208026.1:399-1259(+)
MTEDDAMSALEQQEQRRAAAGNELESFILELKKSCRDPAYNDCFGADPKQVEETADRMEEWLLSQPTDGADAPTEEEYRERLRSLRDLCPQYFERIERERMEKEKALEESAAEKAKEEKEDHDQRKLPVPQRLDLARKNKEEGNDLLKGGNLEMAGLRYRKVLAHVSKIFDANEAQQREADDLSVAANLNLAVCFMKLKQELSYKKAVGYCDAALAIDSANLKGMYRKAACHDKLGELDEAKASLARALEAHPEDPDLAALQESVGNKLKAQETKQKKMFARMLGK